jgi:hypothetical protein
MSSTQRTIAQRDTNVQTVTPVGTNTGIADFIDINVNPVYNKVINVDVRNVTPFNRGVGNYLQLFKIVYDGSIAAQYPGLEFTVFFDSFQASLPVATTVAVKTPDQQDPIESTYPFSAVPGAIVQVLSVTLKSNGRVFSIVANGPSNWD